MLGYFNEHRTVFNAEEIGILTAAFDKAWQLMEASGAKFESGGHAAKVREALWPSTSSKPPSKASVTRSA